MEVGLIADGLHVGVQQDVHKRLEQIEHQPYVYHLHIGSGGEAVTYAEIFFLDWKNILIFLQYILPQEHGCEHKNHGDIQRHQSLKHGVLEVVGHVADHVEDEGGGEGGEDQTEEPPLDHDVHLQHLSVHDPHPDPTDGKLPQVHVTLILEIFGNENNEVLEVSEGYDL